MKQKNGQHRYKGGGTHSMTVGQRERKRFSKHPLTNMSSLTQSHLIDCPLLLCDLGGFEF